LIHYQNCLGTVPAVTHPSLGATVGFLDELCPFRLSLGGLRIARSRERSPAWHSELMERHPLGGKKRKHGEKSPFQQAAVGSWKSSRDWRHLQEVRVRPGLAP